MRLALEGDFRFWSYIFDRVDGPLAQPEPPIDPETIARECSSVPRGANAHDVLTDLLADCYDDPDIFNSAWLGRPDYWWRQTEMCRSVVEYRTTVVYSGNAIGKDYWIGGLVPWWLYTRPQSLVIVTGPTQTVLGSVTWKEIRRAIEGCPIPLFSPRVSSGIKASPALVEIKPGWQALGYSTTSVERASGQHAKHLLVIVEEASGVEPEIWEAIESLKYERLVAIGNPLRTKELSWTSSGRPIVIGPTASLPRGPSTRFACPRPKAPTPSSSNPSSAWLIAPGWTACFAVTAGIASGCAAMLTPWYPSSAPSGSFPMSGSTTPRLCSGQDCPPITLSTEPVGWPWISAREWDEIQLQYL